MLSSKTVIDFHNKLPITNGVVLVFVLSSEIGITVNNYNQFDSNGFFGNYSSTMRASLMGNYLFLPILNGKLVIENDLFVCNFGMNNNVNVDISLTFKAFSDKRFVHKAVKLTDYSKRTSSWERGYFKRQIPKNYGPGLAHIFTLSDKLSITVNECFDPSAIADLDTSLNDICKKRDNIKVSLIGKNVILPFEKGTFDKGTWQGIWNCNFGEGTDYFVSYFPYSKNFMKRTMIVSGNRGSHSLFLFNPSLWMNEVKKVKVGIIHFLIKHTSATVFLHKKNNEKQYEKEINQIAKENMSYYVHNDEGDDDMPGHLKTSYLSPSVSIPISNGKLLMNNDLDILFGEFRNSSGSRKIITIIEGSYL